jgi:hypothetical protein
MAAVEAETGPELPRTRHRERGQTLGAASALPEHARPKCIALGPPNRVTQVRLFIQVRLPHGRAVLAFFHFTCPTLTQTQVRTTDLPSGFL